VFFRYAGLKARLQPCIKTNKNKYKKMNTKKITEELIPIEDGKKMKNGQTPKF
jgi:hypothetical protein